MTANVIALAQPEKTRTRCAWTLMSKAEWMRLHEDSGKRLRATPSSVGRTVYRNRPCRSGGSAFASRQPTGATRSLSRCRCQQRPAPAPCEGRLQQFVSGERLHSRFRSGLDRRAGLPTAFTARTLEQAAATAVLGRRNPALVTANVYLNDWNLVRLRTSPENQFAIPGSALTDRSTALSFLPRAPD